MRSAPFLALLCCILPTSLTAQTSQPGSIHCTVQAAAPLTDADRAFIAGDFAKAESIYTTQISGASPTAGYLGAVRAQLAQNKLGEALDTARRAIAATPNSPDAQSLLGDVLLRSGQIADASAAYTKAVQINPCTARAQFGMGRLSDISSNHLTAARKYAAAHSLAPGDPEISAAFIATQPAPQHAAGLHALLRSNPVLAPGVVSSLTDEAAILDQHKACTLVQEFPTARLELTPLMFSGKFERSWGFKVRLNNADTPLLELDSSVSGIVLNPKDAQKAGVHPLNADTAPTPPYMAFADHVRIGSLEYHDCPVRVVPANELAGSNSLIGTDFFRDHLIHIDYVAQLMTLNPFPTAASLGSQPPATLTDQYIAPGEKDWLPVFVAGSNILLPTTINKKGPYLFVIDTGTSRTVLAPAVESSVLGSSKDATLNFHGVSGAIVKAMPRDGGSDYNVTDVRDPNGVLLRVTTPVKLPTYRISKYDIADDSAVSFDISRKSHDVGYEVSGLLGFYILRGYFLDINYRDGLIQILYDQNQRYETRQRDKQY